MAARFRITRRKSTSDIDAAFKKAQCAAEEAAQSKQLSFHRLDGAMNAYYLSLDRHDYYDRKDRGKLSVFCISNGLDLDDVADELQYGPSQCLLMDFDPDFPIHSDGQSLSEHHRDAIKFSVIQRCFAASNDSKECPQSATSSPLMRMDSALGRFYDGIGRCDYYDGDAAIGKLAAFCRANGVDSEGVDEEMDCAPTDCLLVDFDPDFPLQNGNAIRSPHDRAAAIFAVLRRCHQYGHCDVAAAPSPWPRDDAADIFKKLALGVNVEDDAATQSAVDVDTLFAAATLDEVALFLEDGHSAADCGGYDAVRGSFRCLSVQRICALTTAHHQRFNLWDGSSTIDIAAAGGSAVMRFVRDTFGAQYDAVRILNDFHHVLCAHDGVLEDISGFIGRQITCPLARCGCIARNYRPRRSEAERTLSRGHQSKRALVSESMTERVCTLRRPQSAGCGPLHFLVFLCFAE